MIKAYMKTHLLTILRLLIMMMTVKDHDTAVNRLIITIITWKVWDRCWINMNIIISDDLQNCLESKTDYYIIRLALFNVQFNEDKLRCNLIQFNVYLMFNVSNNIINWFVL